MNLIQFYMVYPYLKLHILFNSNGLALWHSFPVITHIEVKSGRKSAILNLIKKLQTLFNSSGSCYLVRFSRHYAMT